MLLFDDYGQGSAGCFRNRRADELQRLHRFGSKVDFEKVVGPFDMLLFKAADTKIEVLTECVLEQQVLVDCPRRQQRNPCRHPYCRCKYWT